MKKSLLYFINKYLENRPFFYSFIRPKEAELFWKNKKLIKPPILDFGCGDGFFIKTVFGKGKIDIGADLYKSEAIIARREKVYKKVVFYSGKKLPFKNNYFSCVISNCVLEHVENLELSIKEIFRVLKPKGIFIATVMTDNWEKNLIGAKFLGALYKNFLRNKQKHFNLLSYVQWKNLFEKNDLLIKNITGYLHPKTARFLEIAHYFSIPSLLSYIYLRKWVIFKKWHFFIPKELLKKLNNKKVSPQKACALFIVAEKPQK